MIKLLLHFKASGHVGTRGEHIQEGQFRHPEPINYTDRPPVKARWGDHLSLYLFLSLSLCISLSLSLYIYLFIDVSY